VGKLTYWSEVIEIIEAGLEGKPDKVKAYASLLLEKLEMNNLPEDQNMIRMIKSRLDGSYKKAKKVVALEKQKVFDESRK
jgi:hypothetical protein